MQQCKHYYTAIICYVLRDAYDVIRGFHSCEPANKITVQGGPTLAVDRSSRDPSTIILNQWRQLGGGRILRDRHNGGRADRRRRNGFIRRTTACHKPPTFTDKQRIDVVARAAQRRTQMFRSGGGGSTRGGVPRAVLAIATYARHVRVKSVSPGTFRRQLKTHHCQQAFQST